MSDEQPNEQPDPEPESERAEVIAEEEPTPAQRLRALELTGDPDAGEIARSYRSSPLNPTKPFLRQMSRATRASEALTKPTYAYASAADAAEAEAKYANIRAERERRRREREERLYEFAVAADHREASMHRLEESMHRLTKASVAIALVSLTISGTALAAAIIA